MSPLAIAFVSREAVNEASNPVSVHALCRLCSQSSDPKAPQASNTDTVLANTTARFNFRAVDPFVACVLTALTKQVSRRVAIRPFSPVSKLGIGFSPPRPTSDTAGVVL